MDTDANRQFIAGQLAATVAMLRAIVKTHPDQDALKAAFDMSCQIESTAPEFIAGVRAQSHAIWSGLHT